MSNAIDGSNYHACRSFEITASSASTSETALARGSYEVCATQDAYLKLGRTGMGAAAALPSTQPAASSANATIRLYANQRVPLDVMDDLTFVRAIRQGSTDAVIAFHGPLLQASNG